MTTIERAVATHTTHTGGLPVVLCALVQALLIGCSGGSAPGSAPDSLVAAPLSNQVPEDPRSANTRGCLPADYKRMPVRPPEEIPPGQRWDVALYPGQPPTLCARKLAEDGRPAGRECWSLNELGLGDRRPAPTARAGQLSDPTVPLPWTLDNAQGDRQAVISEEQIEMRDVPSGRVIARMPLRDLDHDRGLSAEPSGAYFVGERLYLIDHDAGPHADVIAYTPPTDITQVADEVYHGSVAILDGRRVGLASPGLTRLDIQDVTTGVITRIERQIARPEICSATDFDEFFLEPDFFCYSDDATEGSIVDRHTCCQKLSQTVLPYMDTPMVAIDQRHIAVALTGPRLGHIALIDLDRRAIARELSLFCESPR